MNQGDRTTLGVALVMGGLSIVGAVAAEGPARLVMALVGGIAIAVGGGTLIPWPQVRIWRARHFPRPRDYGAGEIQGTLRVGWERAFLDGYDEQTQMGRVVFKGIRIRNRRREPLELYVLLAFFAPGQNYSVSVQPMSGALSVTVGKKGQCEIPHVEFAVGPFPNRDAYITGQAKLELRDVAVSGRAHFEQLFV